MNPVFLQEQVIRSEGYAEGFRAGYLSCAKWIAVELAKDTKTKLGEGTAEITKTDGN